MPYKCEYNGEVTCDNCKHDNHKGCGKSSGTDCPLDYEYKYPEKKDWCDSCCFEPKEDEMSSFTDTEEEIYEQLELMEELHEESKLTNDAKEKSPDDLIFVGLTREQIENIAEFLDLELIPFIQNEDNCVENIMYLHSMSTAYVTLMEAIGKKP